MLIALNKRLRAHRRRLAVVAVVFTVSAGVLAAHSALAEDHMGMKTSICLAVLDTGLIATGIALIVRLTGRLLLPRALSVLALPDALSRSRPAPRIRAGPMFLQVMRR
jgi:hypothetical protein